MAEKKKKDNEDKESIEEKHEECSRSIQVTTGTSCVEITSESKSDDLEKMKKMAEYFLDKYSK